MWPFRSSEVKKSPQIFLTNTLSGRKELFVPLKQGSVTMYSCGPTVYGPIHIGNLRSYVFSDTIARVLMQAGYHVRRVMNITDVGHLVGEEAGGAGEDKMSVGAAREKVSPADIAARYARGFVEDSAEVGIDTSSIIYPYATEYVKEDIAMAKALEEKGFAYRLPDGLYFDTSRFPNYGMLGNVGHVEMRGGARVKLADGKRNPSDFALWRTAKPNDLQQWDSPWGKGNPGWSIECSAMARALLGIEIDIHTGGEDLAPIHHNNEIAQSEAASGRKFARYWMHNAFLNIDGVKISKSIGNVVHLSDIIAKGYNPLALRYFFLQGHYRTPISFSWNALDAAEGALTRLWRGAEEIAKESGRKSEPSSVRDNFVAHMRDDLATPSAIGVLWDALRDEDYSPQERWGLIEDAEAHLGLSLTDPPTESMPIKHTELPADIAAKLKEREEARARRDYATADRIRKELEYSGYSVDDGPEGAVLTKKVR